MYFDLFGNMEALRIGVVRIRPGLETVDDFKRVLKLSLTEKVAKCLYDIQQDEAGRNQHSAPTFLIKEVCDLVEFESGITRNRRQFDLKLVWPFSGQGFKRVAGRLRDPSNGLVVSKEKKERRYRRYGVGGPFSEEGGQYKSAKIYEDFVVSTMNRAQAQDEKDQDNFLIGFLLQLILSNVLQTLKSLGGQLPIFIPDIRSIDFFQIGSDNRISISVIQQKGGSTTLYNEVWTATRIFQSDNPPEAVPTKFYSLQKNIDLCFQVLLCEYVMSNIFRISHGDLKLNNITVDSDSEASYTIPGRGTTVFREQIYIFDFDFTCVDYNPELSRNRLAFTEDMKHYKCNGSAADVLLFISNFMELMPERRSFERFYSIDPSHPPRYPYAANFPLKNQQIILRKIDRLSRLATNFKQTYVINSRGTLGEGAYGAWPYWIFARKFSIVTQGPEMEFLKKNIRDDKKRKPEKLAKRLQSRQPGKEVQYFTDNLLYLENEFSINNVFRSYLQSLLSAQPHRRLLMAAFSNYTIE